MKHHLLKMTTPTEMQPPTCQTNISKIVRPAGERNNTQDKCSRLGSERASELANSTYETSKHKCKEMALPTDVLFPTSLS